MAPTTLLTLLLKFLLSFIFLVIPFSLYLYLGINIFKNLLLPALRGFIQILILGLVLLYFFKINFAYSILILIYMLFIGSFITVERGRIFGNNTFLISFFSMSISYSILYLLLYAAGIMENVPRVFIPLTGILLGNMTKYITTVYVFIHREIVEKRDVLEALLIDGARKSDILKFLFKEIFFIILLPSVEGMKVLGIIHIPGAMTGMLLSGISPLQAALYQIYIVFSLFASASLAPFISAFFVLAKLEKMVGIKF